MFSLKSLAAALVFSLSTTVIACAAEPADEVTEDTTADIIQAEPAAASAITVVAVAKVKPETASDFKEAGLGLVRGSRREPGNISYAMHVSKDDPSTFVFIEKWRDQAAIDAHMNGQVLGTFFERVKTDFEPGYPTITNLDPIAVR